MAKFAPQTKVMEVVDTNGEFNVATNKTEAVLQAYPDLGAIFSVSAEGAPAAAAVTPSQRSSLLVSSMSASFRVPPGSRVSPRPPSRIVPRPPPARHRPRAAPT